MSRWHVPRGLSPRLVELLEDPCRLRITEFLQGITIGSTKHLHAPMKAHVSSLDSDWHADVGSEGEKMPPPGPAATWMGLVHVLFAT